jgi:glycosyltransferase involved in cell wall biosynthesis
MPIVWQTARNLMTRVKEKRFAVLPFLGLEGVLRLPFAFRRLPTARSVPELTWPHRLRVTYILNKVVIAGGVLSVIQIVNELIRLGFEARIVTFFVDPAIYGWTRLYSEPIVYQNENEMMAHFPPTDIAVATLWNTAPLVERLVQNGRARIGAYFIQDYEPWFFPESDQASRQRVHQTFAMIPNRIVKSRWLAGMLAADGYCTHQILLGMDLGQFYPRDVDKSRSVVLSMVRPKTPYRGFVPTIAALAEVKKRMPDVEIVLFGDRFLSAQFIPFAFRDEGVVMDQNKLTELYSEATVFLDGSDFQGFGRCGLEAMACGAACVLTGSGGVTEYAVDGENAIVVPPKKPDRFAAAILDLLHNPELRSHLIAGGRRTAQRFCHRREARQTRDYFLTLSGGYPGCYPKTEESRQ